MDPSSWKKTTLLAIRDQYKLRNLKGDPDVRFVLKLDTQIVDANAPLQSLDTYGDRLIAFEAVLESEIQARIARQPLKPKNLVSPPHKVIKSEINSPRRSEKIFPVLKSRSRPPQDEILPVPSHYEPPYAEPTYSPRIPIKSEITYGTPSVPPASPFLSRFPGPISTTVPLENLIPGTHETSEPFARYYLQFCKKFPPESSRSEIEKYNMAWRSWSQLPPADRAPFYVHEVSFDPLNDVAPLKEAETTGYEDKKTAFLLDYEKQLEGEDPLEGAGDDSQPIKFQLQTFIADASLEVLETSIDKGVKFLEDLKGPLKGNSERSQEASHWVEQIEKLQKQAVKTKTIIGVVGNTGAGKSSVINAMLDEERLVPTNCMRACTAVVCEISWNDSKRPYRAEIEFITAADWEKELSTLFQDLLDSNGEISKDCANEETDAGIAYCKIKAVYPRKTKEDITNSSIDQMLQEVSHILDKTKKVEEDDSLIFYKHLQKYVDSKEKSTSKKEKNKKEKREMEVWPLIKVVRIYVKSDALATGAVIVDLPGVHDSNAARAVVAEGYMKQCTGLWIVAPINRAVDDKAAKSLLGESFKRQLKMDGGFNQVTFICSKTDDISLMEAQDSLGIEEEMSVSWKEMEAYTRKQMDLKVDLRDMGQSMAAYDGVMADVDEQLETWEPIRDQLEEGKTVYAPLQSTKRKNSGFQGKRKRRKLSSDDETDDDYDKDTETETSDESDEELDRGSPLTKQSVLAKLAEMRTTKKQARRQRTELTEKMEEIRKSISEANEAEQKIEAEMQRICISGRNQYSTTAIQQDFAQGIKELDQEIAAEEDEENFNPDTEIRDYEEIARSLPVFCVSSRGYQKLKGRLRKDGAVPGFKTAQETQMPQLQEHCRQLTVAGRTASCKRFMTNLSQLLNSLTLWGSSDGSGLNLTDSQRELEARVLQSNLKKLERGLENLVESVCKDLKRELSDNIYEKFDTAVANAREEASKTATQWGLPVNREDRPSGGLHWSTYRAICRRNGIYTNAQGPHDWNAQLTEPLIKFIAPGWERTFSRRAPTLLQTLPRDATSLLKAFHSDIDTRARRIGVATAGLYMLQQQLPVYEDIFKDLSATTRDVINAQQKEINREFTPVIERAMIDAYDNCNNEHGVGAFARMKAGMIRHIAAERMTMFQQSTDEVRSRLSQAVRSVEESMLNRADEVFVAMSRDYRSVLGGRDVSQGDIMPKWQRIMQKDVMSIIESAETIFKKAAGIYIQEEETENETTKDEAKVKTDQNTGNSTSRKRQEEDDSMAYSDDDEMDRSPYNSSTLQAKDEIPDTPTASEDFPLKFKDALAS